MLRARTAAILLLLTCAPALSLAQSEPGSPPRPSRPGAVPAQQNCQLSARVMYDDDMRAAERILVKILYNGAPADQVFTDTLGRFESRILGPNVYTVEISVEGYKDVWQQVDLSMFCRSEMPPIMLERDIQMVPQAEGAMVSARELLIPEKARKAFEKGVRELHDKNRPDRSMEYFREAISLYPEYDLAFMQIGLAYAQQGNLDAAETNLEKCTELNNKNTRALVLLGIVHTQQGRAGDSLRVLREAVRIDKTDWLGHYELGRLLGRLGLLDDAYKHAQRAHLLKPEAPNVHVLLHDVAVRRRDYQTALAEVREFLEMFPKNPLAVQMKQQERSLLQSGLVTQ